MFLITLNYKQPLEIVDQFLAEHRQFLEQGYAKNQFIVSGPKNPRVGGIILSQLTDREELMKVIKQDPFYINDVADFDVTEFVPIKYHQHFSQFITDK